MTSILMLIGFALPPLLQLRQVPGSRVALNLEPPPPIRHVRHCAVVDRSAVVVAARLGNAIYVVRDGGTFAILFAAGWLLVRMLAARQRRNLWCYGWRISLAAAATAPHASSRSGRLRCCYVAVARRSMQEWRASLPADAPNYHDQYTRRSVTDQDCRSTSTAAELVPMIRARLVEING
jgi:putative ABC transport system permease protein